MSNSVLQRVGRLLFFSLTASAIILGLRLVVLAVLSRMNFRPPHEVIAHLSMPPGFEASLFACEPMVINPVCLAIDEHNRFYVAETQAYDYNINYPDEELASRTAADAEAIRQRYMTQKRHITGRRERVRLLEAKSGLGKADTVETFDDDFELSDGCAAGILACDQQVWLANSPNLWKYKSNPNGRKAERELLLTGFANRYVNRSHDLHGIVFGPDGKLYFSNGDRGLCVTTKEGKTLSVPETGAVLRCNPDGTELEIYATGFRNPQDLAFDRFGNLFVCDNNSVWNEDTRWLYVVEGSDAGWRIGYESLSEGPWLTEKVWHPESCPPCYLPSVGAIGRCVAGMAFYPGVGFPREYDDHFLACKFDGYVHTCRHEPNGAGFRLQDVKPFVGKMWATDVAFGPDGCLYISDWGYGYDLSQHGRIYRVRHHASAADPIVAETKKLLGDGMHHRSLAELEKLLAHRDQRVRQKSQFELARRGQDAIPCFTRALEPSSPQNARVHAIWGIGQIAVSMPKTLDLLLALMSDADFEVRSQAARVAGDHRYAPAAAALSAAIKDPHPRVRYFAAMGLGKLARIDAIPAILEMLRQEDSRDRYLLHAGVMVLVGTGAAPTIASMRSDSSPTVRLAAVLALGRLADPSIVNFLDDANPTVVVEAARAIYDTPIPAAIPALAALADPPRFPEGAGSRVVMANYRLGTPAPLARLAASAQAPLVARRAALSALALWDRCTGRDLYLGLWRPLPARGNKAAADSVRPVLSGLLRADENREIAAAAARVAVALRVGDVGNELMSLVSDANAPVGLRAEALQALANSNPSMIDSAITVALSSPEEPLRCAAVRLLSPTRQSDAAERLKTFANDPSIPIRQAAIAALGDSNSTASDNLLSQLIEQALDGRQPLAVHLDLADAAAKRPVPSIAEQAARLDRQRPPNDRLSPWQETLEGGDAELGRRVFFENGAASCRRCHKAGGVGGDVAPPLDSVGSKNDRRQLLESIVFPSAVVVPAYRQSTLYLRDGEILIGRIESEADGFAVVILPDGVRRRVRLADIEARSDAGSAMPDGLVKYLTKRQLRDLIAYLASLRDPRSAHEQPTEGPMMHRQRIDRE